MLVNEKLEFIVNQNENNKLSHAFLVETNNIDLVYEDLKTIIKMINCENKFSDKCNKCNICNLIDKDNLPSLITIRPDGASIKRDQIDDLENSFNTKPVFSKYNTYVILNAELMNATSFNVLLKFLEEPNENTIGFLVTKDMKQILPTIKSRCECVTVNYKDTKEVDNNIKEIADKYLDHILNTDDFMVSKNDILSLDLDRITIQQLFLYYYDIYKEKLEVGDLEGAIHAQLMGAQQKAN